MGEGNIIGAGIPRTQAIPIDAILSQFFTGINNSIIVESFVKTHNKTEAEQFLVEAYQNELANWNDFFNKISATDIGSSARVKKELEVVFEQFKNYVMTLYKDKIITE